MSILDLKVRKVLEIAAEFYMTFCMLITTAAIFGYVMHSLVTWMYASK